MRHARSFIKRDKTRELLEYETPLGRTLKFRRVNRTLDSTKQKVSSMIEKIEKLTRIKLKIRVGGSEYGRREGGHQG